MKYHLGHHGDIVISDNVMGLNYLGWSVVHKILIVALSILMIYHVNLNWKWYKVVVTKKLFTKNQQVLILSLLFILVAITGFIPWIIELAKGGEIVRKAFIEVHDKIAIVLTIYFIMHIVKRIKWFLITFEKIKSKNCNQVNV